MTNEIKVEFESLSMNESLARSIAAVFVSYLNPTLEELADIKTAVSEAVTNSIIHGYGNRTGMIQMKCKMHNKTVMIEIVDYGCGIKDVKKAMEPLFTTRPDLERSGMGFAFMEAFMDEIQVQSKPGKGTTIWMKREIGVEIKEEEPIAFAKGNK